MNYYIYSPPPDRQLARSLPMPRPLGGHAPRPVPGVQVDVVPLDRLAVGHLVEAVHVLHALTQAEEEC